MKIQESTKLIRYLLAVCFVFLPYFLSAQENEEKVKRFSRPFGSKPKKQVEKQASPVVILPDTLQQQFPKVENQMTETDITKAVEDGIRRALKQYAKDSLKSSVPTTSTDDMTGKRVAAIYDRYMQKQQMRGRHLQRVDREALKAVFIPKGQWMVGGTVNYQEWDTDNINLLVLKNMDIEGHVFSASPYFGYFVANNLAVGARYNYLRNYFYLGDFDLNLGEDFNISLEDLYYLEQKHEVSAFLRTYMPLGRSNIFGFFGEIRGTYAYANGKNSTGRDTEFDGSYEHVHSIQLGFCPGMTAFVTDFMAVEASIGVMGLKYRWKDQKTNQVEKGSSKMGGANFKFNLFSVNLGMTFYL